MKFNIGHFPVGTICEINVDAIKRTEVVEVRRVFENGPHSFCIETTKFNEDIHGYISYNIVHVTKIIKRGSGNIKFTSLNKDASDNVNSTYKPMRLFQKHKSQFSDIGLIAEINKIGIPYENNRHLLKTNKLYRHLQATGIIKCSFKTIKNINGKDVVEEIFTVNKKKLKCAIKRSVSKFFVDRRKEQKIEYERDMEYYDHDFDHDSCFNLA